MASTYPEYSARYVAKRTRGEMARKHGTYPSELEGSARWAADMGEIGPNPEKIYKESLSDLLGFSAKVRGRKAYLDHITKFGKAR